MGTDNQKRVRGEKALRLIDADRLKKHYSWWENDDKEVFDQIVDTQPTINPDDSWIPVTCATPEPFEDVIVTYQVMEGKNKGKRFVDVAWISSSGEWKGNRDEFRVDDERTIYIAWMPIPKPYGGEIDV